MLTFSAFFFLLTFNSTLTHKSRDLSSSCDSSIHFLPISGTSNVCHLTSDCPKNSFCEPRSGGWDGQCVCQDGYFMQSSGKIRECVPVADYGELCYMNKQCEYRLGREALCKNGQCACKDGTHYNSNENACFNSSSKYEHALSIIHNFTHWVLIHDPHKSFRHPL